MEKIKEFFQDKPWLIGILLAIPVVFIYYLFSRRGATSAQETVPTGMIYQPPASVPIGGGGGGGSQDSSAEQVTDIVGKFLDKVAQQNEESTARQQELLSSFLQIQGDSQQALFERIAQSQGALAESLAESQASFLQQIQEGLGNSIRQSTKTDNYITSLTEGAWGRISDLKAKWNSTSSESARKQYNRQAMAERQNVYQEVTRVGGTARWVDTGVGYQELEVTLPDGTVKRL